MAWRPPLHWPTDHWAGSTGIRSLDNMCWPILFVWFLNRLSCWPFLCTGYIWECGPQAETSQLLYWPDQRIHQTLHRRATGSVRQSHKHTHNLSDMEYSDILLINAYEILIKACAIFSRFTNTHAHCGKPWHHCLLWLQVQHNWPHPQMLSVDLMGVIFLRHSIIKLFSIIQLVKLVIMSLWRCQINVIDSAVGL